MKILQHIAQSLFCLSLLATACTSQTVQSPPTLPLKRLGFSDPDPTVQAQLLIPYRAGELYGICNYQGKLLLKPQFEAIEMPQTDLGFFKARKNGRWSLYDIRGEQLLPCDYPSADALYQQPERTGYDFIGDSRVYHYLTKIKDARGGYLKPIRQVTSQTTGEVAAVDPPIEKPRYFFLHKNTRQPFQSWFLPEYGHLRNQEAHGVFRNNHPNDNNYGLYKVMNEDRQFTLLNREGNPVLPPALDCSALQASKIILYGENGLCALRDLNTGSQTDFRFNDVEKTANPDLCRGKIYENSKPRYFKIDAAGKVEPLPNEYAWMPLNERYSMVLKNPEQQPWIWLLLDEQTGRIVRELPSNQVVTVPEHGVAILKDGQTVAVQTIAGDTLPLPPYPNYKRANDSLYIFFDGDDTGIADVRHRELFRQTGGKISYAGYGSFRLEKDKHVGWVGPGGQLLLPVEYDQIRQIPATNCLIATRNGLSGLFDSRDGRELLPLRYRHLQPNGILPGSGPGFEVREGKDFYIFTPDFGIILQQSENPVVKKSDFALRNASDAATQDFEKASMPRYFTPYLLFSGPNWLHIFQCDGTYITSLEGFFKGESMLYSRHQQLQETDGAIQTGVARAEDRQGKTSYVRLADGFIYHH